MKNYAYTYVAKKYQEQIQQPHILGLTASPGSDKPKIKQICKNLGIKKIEVRTRESEDVKEYLQELEFDILNPMLLYVPNETSSQLSSAAAVETS